MTNNTGWKTIKFGDLPIQIIDGDRSSKYPKRDEFVENGYPFLNTTNITGNRLDLTEINFVSEEKFDQIKKGRLKQFDIVMTTRGSIGKVALFNCQYTTGIINAQMLLVRVEPSLIEPRFLYFVMADEKFQAELRNFSSGSAQPQIPIRDLKDVSVYIPSLPLQQKIAAILSAYDDLIENNLRRIKILEEMAQTLYREWFVKFRLPGHQKVKMVNSPLGKIPEGWETKTIGDVCTVIPGYAFKSSDWQKSGVPVIKIKNINSDNTINTDETDCVSEDLLKPTMEKFLLKDGDILIAMTGATAGKIGKLRSRQRMLLNQRVAKIEPHNPYNAFVWCTICTEECQARFFRLADGAAQPNMSGHQIEGFPILLPTKALCQDFSEMVNPFLLEIDNLIHRNRNLRQTRDLLLPKLISGELDVSELDIAIPEANA